VDSIHNGDIIHSGDNIQHCVQHRVLRTVYSPVDNIHNVDIIQYCRQYTAMWTVSSTDGTKESIKVRVEVIDVEEGKKK
jgi:hypothetical protein